jgi:hypothetical protein
VFPHLGDSGASTSGWSSLHPHTSLARIPLPHSGVQFLGERSGKFHLLLELEVPWIGYMLHMDVGRSTSSLGKVSILHSIQELAMTRMSDHVSWTGSIPNSSIEGMPWGDGKMKNEIIKIYIYTNCREFNEKG